MSEELKALLKALFESFDMESGDWPGTNVFTSTYGRVWGTLPDETVEILQNLYLLVEEDDFGEE